MKVSKLLPISIVLCSFAQPSTAALVFNFNYLDVANGSGVGFDDVTLGSARQAALESAAGTLGAYFTNTSTLNIDINNSQTDGSGSLASGGTSYFSGSNSFQQGLSQIQAQTNTLSSDTHGSATWDFGYNYDLDDSVASNAYDFKSVAMHELLHILGFSSVISANGSSEFSSSTMWTDFDQYLEDGDGNRLISDGATKSFNTSELDDLTGGTGTNPTTSNTGVYFGGANAVAANGGEAVALYSPTVFSGSSLSHLDTDLFGTNGIIMSHAVGTGLSSRELSSIELGILQDLGYGVTAVPVPPAFLLFGSGLMALLGYRRKNS